MSSAGCSEVGPACASSLDNDEGPALGLEFDLERTTGKRWELGARVTSKASSTSFCGRVGVNSAGGDKGTVEPSAGSAETL